MVKQLFVRNVRAGDQLELFLVSAVSSVLLVRFYLHLAGYPQIGGDSLHIAHMLWGGLLMLVAIVLLLGFVGYRVQRLSAFIGGIGFGVFIDELGKFITKDNDYFYQPTIALIYATFAVLFLVFRYLSRTVELSSRDYLLNALVQLEEVVLDDFDKSEKRRVEELLHRAGVKDEFTVSLQNIVATADIKTDSSRKLEFISRFRGRIDDLYVRLLKRRYTNRTVKFVFAIEAFIFLSAMALLISNSIVDILSGHPEALLELQPSIVAEAIFAAMAGIIALVGVYKFSSSRLAAYQLFSQAVLVQIFLTSFFVFYREQFGALPIFLFHVLLFVILRFAISAEERIDSGTVASR